MRTNVYVDGFNLYYGCLKRSPYRWLDLAALCRYILQPHHVIHRIRYFTALVTPRPTDLQAPQRQQAYIRALGTLPNLSVHYGKFLQGIKSMPLAHPVPGAPLLVEVINTEEKGSDVNLATAMLVDALDQDCEAMILISNDSDLVLPVQIVRIRFGLVVGVLNPHRKATWPLRDAATFVRPIRTSALAACQFPATLTDAQGTIVKPAGW